MKPNVVITLAIVALGGILTFVLVLPKFEAIGISQDKLARNKEDAKIAESKFDATRKAITQFKSLTPRDLERVDSAFPDRVDLPDLLVLVDALIAQSGLVGEDITINTGSGESQRSIASSSPEAGTIAPRFITQGEDVSERGEVSISFSVTGSYELFKFFLKKLEQNLRIFDMQSISFSGTGQAGKIADAFRFGVIMNTYYSK